MKKITVISAVILATSFLCGCETYQGNNNYSASNNYYTPSTPYNGKIVYHRYETNRYYAKGDHNLTYNRMYDMPYLYPSANRNCCHLTFEKEYYLNNPKVVTYEENESVNNNPSIDTLYYPELTPIR